MIHNFKDYKKAKIVVEDLRYLSERLNECYLVLFRYKKYAPIKQLLHEIAASKATIDLHLQENEFIVKRKGKREK